MCLDAKRKPSNIEVLHTFPYLSFAFFLGKQKFSGGSATLRLPCISQSKNGTTIATTRNTVPKNRVTKKERERAMSLQGEVRSSKLHRHIELYVWPIFNCVSNLEQRERRNRVHFELESVIEGT